ncbi:MAG TPA: DUF3313 domain-containing protein [Nonomuraea sp.]|nr:DUF3313 domain-containing protein [Nonomuraea sp.]
MAQPSQSLQSSAQLTEDGSSDSWSYRDPKADVTKYKAFIVEPTVVSTDPEAKWGKVSEGDKQKYADLFTTALKSELGKSYSLATEKGPGVGVIRLTLLGVKPASAIAVATKVTPIGFALTSVKSMAGKPGSFSGSAQVAFELMDSQSGELVAAAIRRKSPDALDIGASTSTDGTIAAIAKDSASAIRAGLDKANGK